MPRHFRAFPVAEEASPLKRDVLTPDLAAEMYATGAGDREMGRLDN
jgi:hypothetical protein